MSDFVRPPGREPHAPLPNRPATAAAVLQKWIYGELFTAADLADAAEVTDAVFAKYRSGERSIPAEVAARISRFAMRRRGRSELASMFCDAGHAVLPVSSPAPDGRIQDEVCEAVTSLGDLARYFESDDLDAADRAVTDLLRQAQAAQAEIALRRGRIAG